MRYGSAAILVVAALPSIAQAADVVLSEVLFNPAGADTGFEYVTLENRSSADTNLSGWQLYPDGVGYFTFPVFSLGVGKRATIYLRKDGTTSGDTLYHSAATANMGNTSGSVALFSSSDRSESSIVDFVQWGRAGETWESTAEKATLWTKGDFVAVNPDEEGLILRRKNDGKGVGAWELAAAGSNNQDNQNTEAQSPTPTPEIRSQGGGGGKVYSGPTIVPTIKAYAGKDMHGVAGGEMRFEGKALGWDDDLLDGPQIRFLWNFGDGTLKEGKRVTHVYRYPGVYTATLMVASGEDSARDDITVTIDKNPVIVSELAPSNSGWIEIANPSGTAVDISGWMLKISDAQKFIFPEGTVLASRSFVVTARDVLGFAIPNTDSAVQLLYPNGVLAQEFLYKGFVPIGRSIADINGTVVVAEPTPGAKNESMPQVASKPQQVAAIVSPKQTNNIIAPAVATATPVQLVFTDERKSEGERQSEEAPNLPTAQLFKSNLTWLLGSVAAGLVAGVAILFLKKRRMKEDA